MQVIVTVQTTAGNTITSLPVESNEKQYEEVRTFFKELLRDGKNGHVTVDTEDGEVMMSIKKVDYFIFKKVDNAEVS